MSLQDRIAELIAQHGTLRAVSRELAIDVGYLSRLERGLKDEPSEEVLSKLGLRRVVRYERLHHPALMPSLLREPLGRIPQ